MKKLALGLIVLLLGMGVYAKDFKVTITNNTGNAVQYIHIAPSDSEDWEDDVLKGKVLKDGQSFTVTVKGYDSYIFDVKVEDENGTTYTKWEQDFTTAASRKVSFTFDDMDPAEEDDYGYGDYGYEDDYYEDDYEGDD